MKRDTIAVHAGRPSEGPLSPPVVLAANYRTYGYAREDGSPTWAALETAVAELEGGGESVAFSTGMAAASAVLEPLPVGARVVGPAVGYTGVRMLLRERAAAGRVELVEADMTDTEAVLRECEGAALLWVETPTNPLVGVAELDRLIEGAHAAGAAVAVDATFATPLLQRPLELGADAVIHSATKYISGHSDLMLGIATHPRRGAGGDAPPHARLDGRDAGRPRGLPGACAACARWRCASSARRRRRPCWPSAWPPTRRSPRSTTRAWRPTRSTTAPRG